MEIFDLTSKFISVKSKKKAGLPSDLLCIIAGPPGCGKTNLFANVALIPGYVDYDNLIIFSITPNQPLWVRMKEAFEKSGNGHRLIFTHDESIFEELSPENTYLICFDDVMLEKQRVIQDDFTHGRNHNFKCCYLAQTYTRIPAALIRDCTNLIVVFPQCDRNLVMIHRDHCSSDMSFAEMKNLCWECWKE